MKDSSMYDLYINCFPDYPVSQTLFYELLKPKEACILCKWQEDKLIGFSMIHSNSIALLCVDRRFRNKGIGSELLYRSEQYISQSNVGKIMLGRGKHYLLQGVPADTEGNVRFFKKRGYLASWTSVNMSLALDRFLPEKLNIPQAPAGVAFCFARSADMPALLEAVDDVKSAWRDVYKVCADPVFIAAKDGRVVGFEILAPTGGRVAKMGEQVGCVGCVGVIRAAREKGIGRQMVVKGIEWLKSKNCTSIELRSVELVNWYTRIGFKITRHQWMGEKTIKGK